MNPSTFVLSRHYSTFYRNVDGCVGKLDQRFLGIAAQQLVHAVTRQARGSYCKRQDSGIEFA